MTDRSSEMVERVARAIISRRYGPSMFDLVNDDLGLVHDWFGEARAAIEAMREPTEAMIDAGIIASEQQSVSAIYRAMIDAALASKGDEG